MKVFIAGPRVVKELDSNIISKLKSIYDKNYEVLVGDSIGIDSSVQDFFAARGYQDVTVYASNGFARNNNGNWNVRNVPVASNITGFDYYAEKDIQMAKDADVGFMIWNGESRGTFNDIVNLLQMNKEVVLYFVPTKKFYDLKNMNELNKFLGINVKLNNKLRKILPRDNENYKQVCLTDII